MMVRREPCRNGAELDTVTAWRGTNRQGRSFWKRRMRRRERRKAKQDLLKVMNR
jgi:hypothetical protein